MTAFTEIIDPMSKPTFLLATNNQHKKHELQQIMSGINLVTPDELGIEFDCDETGKTFLENSVLKAQTLFSLAGKPVIADDSGLCVEGLEGAPGIFSARFGSPEHGPDLESPERNTFLLKSMSGVRGPEERTATFVCCMSAILDQYRIYTVQETMKGYIADEPYGKGGFGYDPVFFLPGEGKTVAELSDAEKNLISHRGRAAMRLNNLLKGAEIE
ncbi:MAG: RdgB/HAM1 family non-canonical purine NTP pyrophosphatase [Spirochaetales bacterium]|uniref:dITP/XTP pyrophosphatase n=1 Tax=Candidatus Thalassospirochaeta sargassi TaxID=3119039 RepID=A0AAJ1MIZ6_9SPIO|nr:RdgB/HAM1 family non-canonical purine NTP pyrophosphatase [Spirochaetales bacterium]